MTGKNGLCVRDTWAKLFEENEQLASRGKALTDDQLAKKMLKTHPRCRTIARIRMVRSDYNAGRGMFAAKVGAQWKSFRYEDGKTPIEDLTHAPAKETAKKKV